MSFDFMAVFTIYKVILFYRIEFISLFIAFKVQVMTDLFSCKSPTQLLTDLSQDLRVFLVSYLAQTTHNVLYVKVQFHHHSIKCLHARGYLEYVRYYSNLSGPRF